MKKLTAEKIDNIMGAMSCIVTGLSYGSHYDGTLLIF